MGVRIRWCCPDGRITRRLFMAVVGWLILLPVFRSHAGAQSAASRSSRQSAESRAFTRDVLLSRFDRNRDGKLDPKERSALRAAFGGIDVPMLPSKPYGYSEVELPAYVKVSDLRGLDNTPADNRLTAAGAALGRVLFYDRRLSRNDSIACASCHIQKAGFSDPRKFSLGFDGGRTGRNSMGLANIRYTNLKGERPGFFWDERAASLEQQVLMPIQDKVEMGMTLQNLEVKLQKLPYYPPLFGAAFGSQKVTSQRIGMAVAQFMRSMLSFHSKFDRGAALAKNGDLSVDFSNFTARENRGKSLFIDGIGGVTELGCAMCHAPPTFNMHKSFNIGLDAKSKDAGLGALGRKSNDPFTPSNHGKFKPSSLRNIALTAPYMHDGRFKTLEKVVEHYSSGVHSHKNLGLAVEPDKTGKPTSGFRYSKREKAALVAFLKTLTDAQFISDSRFSDPFLRAVKPPAVKSRTDSPKKVNTSPADRFKSLVKQYENEGRSRALTRKFLDLARRHPKSPVAVDALMWVASKSRGGAELKQALETLSKNHLKNPKLADLCRRLARKPSTATERLLRKLLKDSPHKAVRAQACFHLADYLKRQIQRIETLKADPNQARRLDQYYGQGFSKRLLSLNMAKMSQEIERLYELTVKSFAAVKFGEGTMGAVATKRLFAMRHLALGKSAPEITGKDVNGKPFKLSDYRGKIVLLDFWGHW